MNEIVRLTFTPMIAAASGSCDVARIALPCRVDLTSQLSRSRTGMVTSTAKSWFHWYVTPPILKTFDSEISGGRLRKFTSKTASEMFWMMNDMPTAVISTASRGA